MNKTLYPKTARIWNCKIIITEKLDGSNLWIFKINWKILIAQRNHCFYTDELDKSLMYKWLFVRLNENKDKLDLCEWSWIFGEWIWMGQINYTWTDIDKKFYIFAKANIDENLEVRNLNYDRSLFIHPFESKIIPDFIWVVPWILETDVISIDKLDNLYDSYHKLVNRKVEWFIINNNNQITKYVRFKNWKESKHIIK
jgi:hypothetical protein